MRCSKLVLLILYGDVQGHPVTLCFSKHIRFQCRVSRELAQSNFWKEISLICKFGTFSLLELLLFD